MTEQKTRVAGTPFPFPNTLPDMQMMMMAAPRMQATLMKAMIDQQKELFAFLERRCDEDMKLANQIASASSIGDIYSAYLHFCKDAATQYAAEAGRVSEIGSRETIEVAHDLEQQQTEIIKAVGNRVDAKESAAA